MADDHLPPPPTLPLLFHHGLLPYLLLTTALAIPHRPRLVAAIFLPLLWASYHRLLQSTSPSPPAGFALGAFVVFHAAFSLDLLLLRNPRHEFTRAPHAQPYPLTSLPQRLVWAIDLATGMRGIGWNWAARPVPRETATALRGFLATRLRRLLLLWAWLDASMFWMQQVDAAFFLPPGNTYHVPGSSQGAVYTSLFAASSRPQVLALPKGFPALPDSAVGSAAYRAALHLFRTLLQGSVVYAAIDGAYTALALVFCCIGGLTRGRGGRWLDWRYWPDVFAAWSDGWGDGLTGCWGRAWHGLFKYTFTSPSRYLIRALRLPPDSPATVALKLFTPFAMSALLHFNASHTRAASTGWGSARFFLLQPLGILLEQALLRAYRRARWRVSARVAVCASCAWVVAWVAVTSGSLFEDVRYSGMWALQPVPVSVWRGVAGVGEGWWAWRRDTEVGWRPWWGWDRSLGGWGVRL